MQSWKEIVLWSQRWSKLHCVSTGWTYLNLISHKTDLLLWFSIDTNKSRVIKLPLIQFVQLYVNSNITDLYAINFNTHLALPPVNSRQQMCPLTNTHQLQVFPPKARHHGCFWGQAVKTVEARHRLWMAVLICWPLSLLALKCMLWWLGNHPHSACTWRLLLWFKYRDTCLLSACILYCESNRLQPLYKGTD